MLTIKIKTARTLSKACFTASSCILGMFSRFLLAPGSIR